MRNKNKKLLVAFLAIFTFMAVFLVVPEVLAQAQDLAGVQPLEDTGLGNQDIRITIANIIRIIMGFLGVVGILIVLYGGYLYLTSGGNADKVTLARRLLVNAGIGLIIVFSAYAITTFVINQLSDATGSGGGAGGIGSQGRGSSSGPVILPTDVFLVSGISPQGQVSLRNISVKIAFNQNIASNTVDGNIIIRDLEQNTEVPVDYDVSGSRVFVTPQQTCPGVESQRCFESNRQYAVEIVSGSNGVQSTSGQLLRCGLAGTSCEASFTSGDIIDSSDPEITFVTPAANAFVSAESLVFLEASAKDDAGLGVVEFYENSVASENLIQVVAPGLTQSPTEYTFAANWSTAGRISGSRATLIAVVYDLDGNTSQDQVDVTLRAAHCFDGTQNQDETDIDCGGADCGACSGLACTVNSECSSNICENGQCISLPIVQNVDPANGAVGNYLTITGENFGNSDGQIIFLGDASTSDDDVIGLDPSCGSVWSDTQVIIQVPQNVQSGPIRLVTSQNLSDRTDDDRGWTGDFTLNNTVRPGVCNISPTRGESGTRVSLRGVNFSNIPGEVWFGSLQASVIGTWSDTQVNQAVAPAVGAGKTGVYVSVNGQASNALQFETIESKLAPRISYINPSSGATGQYITIFGENFGASTGQAFFVAPDGSEILADTNFPDQCDGNFWHNDYITVKVPRGENGDYKVKVVTQGNRETNQVDFTVNSRALTPGICAVLPDNGPEGSNVEIYGENFGTQSGDATVQFSDNISVGEITSWELNAIQTTVPNGAITGPLQVVDAAGTLSNEILFEVGRCSATSCGAGQECCANGSCQLSGSCQIEASACTYIWGFSTGLFQTNLANALRVIENPQCTLGTQSPSPYLDSTDACVNADISVQFNKNVADASIKAGNIVLQRCGQGDSFNPAECQAAGQMCSVQIINHDEAREGFQIRPSTLLSAGTWYQVTLKQASTTNAGSVNYDGFVSEDGYTLTADYSWHFKVRDSNELCSVNSVAVQPVNATIAFPNGMQDYTAAGIASNCNVVSPGGCTQSFNWSWRTSDAARASIQAGAGNQSIATGLQETLAGQPVIISATQQETGLSGSGELVVDFANPEVVEFWPNCTDACVNAQLGAKFSLPMDETTLNAANIQLFQCADPSCSTQLSQVAIANLSYNAEDFEITFVPAQSILSISANYRVILAAGSAGVRSASGTILTNLNYPGGTLNAYSWTFATKNDGSICSIDRVDVSPETKDVFLIGVTQDYTANAYGAPDSCSLRGQRLNTASYSWGWNSTDQGVASISNNDNDPLDSRVDPQQIATVVGLGNASGDASGDVIGQTQIEAIAADRTGSGTLQIHCGYQSDTECPSPATIDTHGVGENTCCYVRPRIENVIPPSNQGGICRNSIVLAQFNQLMDFASIQGAMTVERDFGGASCPGLVSKAGSVLGNIKNFFLNIFGVKPAEAQQNWCAVPGELGIEIREENGVQKHVLTFAPRELFAANAAYRIRIDGDDNVNDTNKSGVRNQQGVVMNGDFVSTFQTGAEICAIDHVIAKVSPPDAAKSFDLFTCARDDCSDDQSSQPGNQHKYSSQAYDANGLPLIANYEWNRSGNNVTSLSGTDDQGNCEPTQLDRSIDQNICVTGSANNGDDVISVFATSPYDDSSAVRSVEAKIFLCENPWPSLQEYPYIDPETNFNIFYCRDKGESGFADDLPALQLPIKGNGPADEPNIFREFLFFTQD